MARMEIEPGPGAESELVERAVLDEVASLLHDLGRDAAAIGPKSDLAGEFGLDSLAIVELHERLERAFAVRLPEAVLATAVTPADWAAAILGARQGTGGGPEVVTRPRAPIEARAVGEPWPEEARTLTESLDWHVDAHPDRVAVRLLAMSSESDVEEVTYLGLREEAARCARALMADGLSRGDRVAIMLPTCREFFSVFVGVLLAGGVPVPLYPPARPSALEEHLRRLARVLANAGATVLVTVPEALLAGRLLRSHVPTLRVVRTPSALAEAGGGRQPLVVPSADDIALIQYTSGSTGDPKGVVLTHAQLLANIRAMGQAAEVDSSDVFVSWLPLYHDMGLIGAWHAASIYFGMLLVIMSPLRFLARPTSWLQAISEHRGTLSAAPNFAYQSCVDRVSDEERAGLDLSSWRVAFNGSEPVSALTVERFIDRFGPCGFGRGAMCPAYGLAEVGVGMAFTPIGHGPTIDRIQRATLQRSGRAEPPPDDDPWAMDVVSCGVPLPGYEIRVVGPSGEELPDRWEGEVECRGPSATAGYFANPAANRSLWRRGWLVTGDRGYVAGGELFLTGRSKDLVIRGGRNLHPEDVEQPLTEIPGVRRGGVVVFGSPDPRLASERLVVVAETDVEDPAAREALEWQITQTATHLLGATPDQVALVTPGAVLRTPSGKIRRTDTREAFERGTLGSAPPPVALQLGRFALSSLAATGRHLGARSGALCYGAYAWLVAVLAAVVADAILQMPVSLRTRWRLVRAVGRALCSATGITIQVDGTLPTKGGGVVVANHASFLDGAVLLVASPEPLVFVASTELGNHKLFGGFLRKLGCVFVERGQPGRSEHDVANLEAVVADRRDRLLVFPEGSIVRAPGVRRFHLGAFAVATAAGCPVVPVGIRGTRDILRPGTRLPRRGQIEVVVGPPIESGADGFAAELALAEQARRAVAALSGEPELPED